MTTTQVRTTLSCRACFFASQPCFLASDDASFIHGHTIPVAGGSPIR